MSSRTLTAAVLEMHSVVEIHAKVEEASWFAIAEAQSDDHLRVRLCPNDHGAPPTWPEGTALQCVLEGNDGRYHTEAVVLKQSNDIVWFHLPPISTRIDRRKANRVTGGMPVTYHVGEVDGIGICLNISAAGMRLRLPVELPERTQLELYFILPGETMPIRTRGVITHIAAPDNGQAAVDAGIKFLSPSPADVARVARFCRI